MKSYIIIGIVAALAIAAIFHPPARPAAFSVAAVSTSAPSAIGHKRSSNTLIVYVAGAVAKAGLYRLAAGARAVDAVHLAGGLRSDADAAGVNLAEPLADGEEIAVPVVGAAKPRRAAPIGRSHRKKKAAMPLTADAQIDLNSADAQTLARLPGIGPELAARLVQFRNANGAFASVDELADVAGMTPRLIDAIAPYVVVNR